jgi:hypothetical protein
MDTFSEQICIDGWWRDPYSCTGTGRCWSVLGFRVTPKPSRPNHILTSLVWLVTDSAGFLAHLYQVQWAWHVSKLADADWGVAAVQLPRGMQGVIMGWV